MKLKKEKLRKEREEDRKKKKEEEDKIAKEQGKKVEEPKKKETKKPKVPVKKPAPKQVDKYGGRKIKFNRPTEAHGINQLKKEDKDFKIKKIVCGNHHTVLLDEGGNAYAWGSNKFGQCGVNKKDEVIMEPTRVELNDVTDIATGGNHTFFLLKNGTVYACGLAKDDRYPSKSDHEIKPVKVDGLDKHKVIGISCGKRHNIFLTE